MAIGPRDPGAIPAPGGAVPRPLPRHHAASRRPGPPPGRRRARTSDRRPHHRTPGTGRRVRRHRGRAGGQRPLKQRPAIHARAPRAACRIRARRRGSARSGRPAPDLGRGGGREPPDTPSEAIPSPPARVFPEHTGLRWGHVELEAKHLKGSARQRRSPSRAPHGAADARGRRTPCPPSATAATCTPKNPCSGPPGRSADAAQLRRTWIPANQRTGLAVDTRRDSESLPEAGDLPALSLQRVSRLGARLSRCSARGSVRCSCRGAVIRSQSSALGAENRSFYATAGRAAGARPKSRRRDRAARRPECRAPWGLLVSRWSPQT